MTAAIKPRKKSLNMQRAIVCLTICALTACSISCSISSSESSTTDSICTIQDCPEGVTLAQMRRTTVDEAIEDGAPRYVVATCGTAGPGEVVCQADFFQFRTVCNWRGCNADGSRCDVFEGCHLVDRGTGVPPPPTPPVVSGDPGICTIEDCPEGQTLSQMRETVRQTAVDRGVPRSTLGYVDCTNIGPTMIGCWADVGNLRFVCNWSGCDQQENRCTTLDECHVLTCDNNGNCHQ